MKYPDYVEIKNTKKFCFFRFQEETRDFFNNLGAETLNFNAVKIPAFELMHKIIFVQDFMLYKLIIYRILMLNFISD